MTCHVATYRYQRFLKVLSREDNNGDNQKKTFGLGYSGQACYRVPGASGTIWELGTDSFHVYSALHTGTLHASFLNLTESRIFARRARRTLLRLSRISLWIRGATSKLSSRPDIVIWELGIDSFMLNPPYIRVLCMLAKKKKTEPKIIELKRAEFLT